MTYVNDNIIITLFNDHNKLKDLMTVT